MGKLRAFEVVFSNAHGVFQAGDMVRGHLYVDFSEPVKLRSISVECHGKAKVHWDKWMLRDSVRAYYECYRAEESYFKKEVHLYGNAIGGTPVLHPSGRQQYNFEFPLPAELPSSFEGTHGYVRYFCKATIERPWKFDQSAKKAFSVLHHLDLNQEAAVRAPIEFERQSPVHCCWCPLGSMTATLQLQHRGFVPGQNILINAEIHNSSNTTVVHTKVILCQHIKFYALHQGVPNSAISCTSKLKQNTTSRIVKCILKSGVEPGQTQTWDAEPLHIPSLPPSRLDGCKIIEIFYTVTLMVEPQWGPKLQISTEVILGTVPLRQVITCPPSYSAVLSERRPSSPPPPFDDIPPPTYEESVFGHIEFEDEEEQEVFDYTPVYAYYNWEQLTPTLLSSGASNTTLNTHSAFRELQASPPTWPSSPTHDAPRLEDTDETLDAVTNHIPETLVLPLTERAEEQEEVPLIQQLTAEGTAHQSHAKPPGRARRNLHQHTPPGGAQRNLHHQSTPPTIGSHRNLHNHRPPGGARLNQQPGTPPGGAQRNQQHAGNGHVRMGAETGSGGRK